MIDQIIINTLYRFEINHVFLFERIVKLEKVVMNSRVTTVDEAIGQVMQYLEGAMQNVNNSLLNEGHDSLSSSCINDCLDFIESRIYDDLR